MHWMKLLKLIFFTTALSLVCNIGLSEVNLKLKQAQEILNEMGYEAGTSDGLWGRKTKTALQKFFKSNDLFFDGIFNDDDLLLLIEKNKKLTNSNLANVKKSLGEAEKASINGRWRGILICDFDKEKWGGGEYKLGNGKFSGAIDFTIIKDWDDPTKMIFKKSNWIDYGGESRKIQSFKISKYSFSVIDKFRQYEDTWVGQLVSSNVMEVIGNWDQCRAKLFRTEEIIFSSYSPKNLIDYVDGIGNDKKFFIPGQLTFPEGNQERYPIMILIVNSGCGYNFRNFTYGFDIKNQGVATLELDNCKPRGLSEFNPIAAGNSQKLTPWMGAADALHALKFLQSHPKVDADKIGIIGFSWGGQVALWTGIDLVRKSIVGDKVDFALRVPYYPYCRYFDDPKYSRNKLHFFIRKLDAVPPKYCSEMSNNFNNLGYDVSIDVYPGAYHNFDDPFWDSPPPEFTNKSWYVTDKCNLWIARDHTRSWRLRDMRIEIDDYFD